MEQNFLFVYGTLKEGYSNNHILDDSKKIGEAITKNKYAMYSNGYFPYLVDNEENINIKGELYEINERTLQRCDRLEGYPRFYDRKLIDVLVKNKTYKAWCYINNNINKKTLKDVLSGEFV